MEPVTRELAVESPVPGGPGDAGTTVGARPAPTLGSTALVSVAFLGTNALAYVFTVLAARALLPAAYGELAALLGVLLVGTVPATGVQTVAALHLGARSLGSAGRARLHATALLVGLATCAVGVLAIALLRVALHLSGSGALGWLMAGLLPHTLIAGYQGLLQGARRYRRLAVITLAFGTLKLVGGTVGLLYGSSTTTTLAGLTVGALAGALVGWLAAGRPGLRSDVRSPLLAVLRASGALLGFVVLLNLDLLLARHYLPATAAGEYAVAALFAKVAYWLPQGVGVVLLPRLAVAAERRSALPAALGSIAAVGAVLSLGTAALGASTLPLVGGAAYGTGLGSLTWLFALLGTLCALAQVLVYSGIAESDRIAVTTVWTASVVECAVVAALASGGLLSMRMLVVTAVGTAAVVVAVGLVRALPRRDA